MATNVINGRVAALASKLESDRLSTTERVSFRRWGGDGDQKSGIGTRKYTETIEYTTAKPV